jgi:hypothetical protein
MFLDNLKFFKTPRHKQFNYQPRYWDPEKEELEKRVAATKKEMEAEKDFSKDALRERIDFRARQTAKRPDFMTNIRVLVIAAILAAVLYFVYTYL